MNQTDLDPFQELLDSLRRVLNPSVTTTTIPAPVSSPVTSPSGPIYAASPMVNPAPTLARRAIVECSNGLNPCGSRMDWPNNLWKHFCEVFEQPVGDASIGEQLYHLKQGSSSIHDYALRFRTLAASSSWNERSRLTTY